jgi:hypothetical protein
MKKNSKILFFTFLTGLISLLLVLELYSVLAANLGNDAVRETNNGNFERSVNSIYDSGESGFTFAVAGDTRSFGTYEDIMESLKDVPLAFMINLGDIVNRGTVGQYRYFRREFMNEISEKFPVFYAVGNEDLNKGTVKIEDWEKIFGPADFYFAFKNSLFIILNVPDKHVDTAASFDFFQQTLESERNKYANAFVFLHRSPTLIDGVKGGFTHEDRFLKLIKDYNVSKVFSGDYHGYVEAKKDGSEFVVTGAGGAHLSDPYEKVHHCLLVGVDGKDIFIRMLTADKRNSVFDKAELIAIEDVWPRMLKYWYYFAAGNVLMLLLLSRSVKKLKEPESI